MDRSTRYVSLISSLPYCGKLFGVKHTPLSYQRLQNRLNELDPIDADHLERLRNLVEWRHHSMEHTDHEIVELTGKFCAELENPTLQAILSQRMEMRSVLVALRRRHLSMSIPTEKQWGYGRWTNHIARYWSEPHFRLELVFPWIIEARQHLEHGDSLMLERLLLNVAWRALEQHAQDHYFDFEAVVIYVLRWSLVERWLRYDKKVAMARFQQLMLDGLDSLDPCYQQVPQQ